MDCTSPNKFSVLPSFDLRESRRDRTHVPSHGWLHREDETGGTGNICGRLCSMELIVRSTKSVERQLVVLTPRVVA